MVGKLGIKSFDKPRPRHRKGLWSPEEDLKLKNYVIQNGHGCWSSVPINAGLQRNGKSCRLRWINYLRPGLKRGTFSIQEEETILTLHNMLGNKWSQIAQHLPGRTDNEIKNYWHSYLKKKISKSEDDSETQTKTQSSTPSISENTESIPQFSFYEPLQNSQKPEPNPNQSLTQVSSFPKLFFAEWLPENGQVGSFSSSTKPEPTTHCLDNNLTYQDSMIQNYLLNEAAFGGEVHNGLSNDMFSSQFRFDDQISGSTGFSGSVSGEEAYIDYGMSMNMSNDVIYM